MGHRGRWLAVRTKGGASPPCLTLLTIFHCNEPTSPEPGNSQKALESSTLMPERDDPYAGCKTPAIPHYLRGDHGIRKGRFVTFAGVFRGPFSKTRR